ncbi:hypothetical protein I4F81_002079 [Pyropia yezoensis]|uniref:Uncharacterized protein n=1 Tax=Pyropia yezoensis TaxID=2788 RepID=A0ACC3BPD9_PYRYE|nr:hypothetical protein I4F81_002079 [Neopyropia yezoensis]
MPVPAVARMRRRAHGDGGHRHWRGHRLRLAPPPDGEQPQQQQPDEQRQAHHTPNDNPRNGPPRQAHVVRVDDHRGGGKGAKRGAHRPAAGADAPVGARQVALPDRHPAAGGTHKAVAKRLAPAARVVVVVVWVKAQRGRALGHLCRLGRRLGRRPRPLRRMGASSPAAAAPPAAPPTATLAAATVVGPAVLVRTATRQAGARAVEAAVAVAQAGHHRLCTSRRDGPRLKAPSRHAQALPAPTVAEGAAAVCHARPTGRVAGRRTGRYDRRHDQQQQQLEGGGGSGGSGGGGGGGAPSPPHGRRHGSSQVWRANRSHEEGGSGIGWKRVLGSGGGEGGDAQGRRRFSRPR